MRRAASVAFAAVLLLASGLAVLPSAEAAADPPLVRADPGRVEVVAGGQFRGFLSVTSQSDFGDAFDVGGIAGSPSAVGIAVSMDASSVALAPFETKKVGFLVQVPSSHPAGTHLLRFDASGTNLSSSGYLFVHVVPYRDGSSDGGLLPAVDNIDIGAAITEGGVFEQSLRLRNQNTTDRVYPVRTRAPPGWSLTASTDGILLRVNATEEITVRGEPGPNAVNGTGYVEIGWEEVHTLVQVSLNVTRSNASQAMLETNVAIEIVGGTLEIPFGSKRPVQFVVRDLSGNGWSGDVELSADSGFLAEGSTTLLVPPGGSSPLAPMVSAPTLAPGASGFVTARIGDVVAHQQVVVAGSFRISSTVKEVQLEAGQERSIQLDVSNTGTYPWHGSLNITAPPGVEVEGDVDYQIEAGGMVARIFTLRALPGVQSGEVHFILHEGRIWRIAVNQPLEELATVDIWGDRAEITLEETGVVPVNISIWNNGTDFWNENVEIVASPSVVVSGDPSYVLPPGGRGARQFNFSHAPGTPLGESEVLFRVPGGEWRVLVRAPASAFPSALLDGQVAAASDGAIDIVLDRETLAIEAGQRGMVQATLRNRGETTWSGDLLRTPSAGLELVGETGPFTLAPGGEQRVDVFVTLATGTNGTVLFSAGGGRATLVVAPPVTTSSPDDADDTGDVSTRLDPTVAVALSAGGVAVAASAAAAAPRRWPLAFAGLYARLAGSRLLEHPVRRRMRTLVEMAPGITYNEIGRQLDLDRGVLDHHLRKLEKSGLVSGVTDGQYRRYYAPGSAHPAVKGALDERILRVVRERGETRAGEVAATLGVSRQAMHYHLRRMVREGSIVANRGSGGLILRANA